jgi:SAM-dependent methyltransferase
MHSHRNVFPLAAAAAALALALAPRGGAAAEDAGATVRIPDVIYVPTPEQVVETMIELARIRPGDVVYDLGCGDGRLVVAAAQAGARKAVGIDIDPERIAESRDNVRAAGVGDRATILEGDLFDLDIADADVVTLYLLPELNLRLRPKLLRLKPGARVVSHAFDMGDWKPDQVAHVAGKTVYMWTVPPRGRAQARTAR